MKKIILFTVLSALALTGCNEDKFLEEKALDFNSASNSYNTKADFDAAVTELYFLTREEFYTTYDRTTDLSKVADMWITADPLQSNVTADFSPSGAIAKFYWDENYKLIAQANTVISRLPSATGLTDDQKKEYVDDVFEEIEKNGFKNPDLPSVSGEVSWKLFGIFD